MVRVEGPTASSPACYRVLFPVEQLALHGVVAITISQCNVQIIALSCFDSVFDLGYEMLSPHTALCCTCLCAGLTLNMLGPAVRNYSPSRLADLAGNAFNKAPFFLVTSIGLMILGSMCDVDQKQ